MGYRYQGQEIAGKDRLQTQTCKGLNMPKLRTDVQMKEEAVLDIKTDQMVVTAKECRGCRRVKPITEYFKTKVTKDGIRGTCKECNYRGNQKTNERYIQSLESGGIPFEKMKDVMKAIAQCYLENPRVKIQEVAERLGLKVSTIRAYSYTNPYIRALRLVASNKVSLMLPKAIKALEDSLDSGVPDVKLKASLKLLENENILGPSKLDVKVDDIRSRPVEELQAIIERAKAIPMPTMDAEVIS